MAGTDRDYYLSRAKREREIAISCSDNAVALTHVRFAEEYERRAASLTHASSLRPMAALSRRALPSG